VFGNDHVRTKTQMKEERIDSIVRLLQNFEPTALAELRQGYPDEPSLFRDRIVMGSEPTSQSGLKVRTAVCAKGLSSAMRVCNRLLPIIRKKLRRANYLRFISEIITVIAGASVFTVLATNFPGFVRYVVAILALAGSLLAMAATYFGGTFHPAGGSLADNYTELVDCQVEAKQLLGELQMSSSNGVTDAAAEELIRNGNSVCARILKVASFAS
jgi:hypothetical protein